MALNDYRYQHSYMRTIYSLRDVIYIRSNVSLTPFRLTLENTLLQGI
jgi:hypothetical protein